jgi:hypothetical protein
MSPPRGTMNGAPRQSEGREAQESWGSGDGSPDSFAPRDPEVQADLDVKPPKGERGGAATKASTRSNGSTLWRVEPQEGIDGRNPCGSGGSTDSLREQRPEAGRVACAFLRGGVVRQVTARGPGLREEHRSQRGEILVG